MIAQDIVDAALLKLGVTSAGDGASDDERAAGLAALSQMLACWWEALRRALAGSYCSALYTFVQPEDYPLLTTAVTVSPAWIRAYVYCLAIELAPEFGRNVSPELGAIAEKAKAAVVTLPAPLI